MLRKLIVILVMVMLSPMTHGAIIEGNHNGKVILNFVYDYQCPYCHSTYVELLGVIGDHPELKIRLLPVARLNQDSMSQAVMMIALSKNDNGFLILNQLLLSGPPLNGNEFRRFIYESSLNHPANIAENHVEIKAQLDEGNAMLEQYQSPGVPLIVIEGENGGVEVIRGAKTQYQIEDAISHVIQ